LPEENRGGKGQANTEEKNRPVHLDDRFGGERVFREPGNDEREASPGEEHAENGSGKGDGERFGEELPNNTETFGADGGTDGELLLALCTAGEKENGDVGATDEEQRGDGAEE
jgi:hypothetical protein